VIRAYLDNRDRRSKRGEISADSVKLHIVGISDDLGITVTRWQSEASIAGEVGLARYSQVLAEGPDLPKATESPKRS